MMCNVIARYHYMVGCDLHTAEILFPSPPITPKTPHFVFAYARLFPTWMAWFQESPNIVTVMGEPLSKIFDIGMGTVHLGANHPFLLFLLTLTASSQGHFGLTRVRIKTNSGEGPVAVALGMCINPQLNCNDMFMMPKTTPLALPLPTGLLSAPNTVVGGLTLGDFMIGISTMMLSMIVTSVIARGMYRAGKGVQFLVGKALAKTALRYPIAKAIMRMRRASRRRAAQSPAVGAYLKKIYELYASWSIGSPSGYSFTTNPDAPIRWLRDAPLGSTLNADHEILWGTVKVPNIQGIVEPPAPGAEDPTGVYQYYNNPNITSFP